MSSVIFGKNSTERIVNISYKDNNIHYFIETIDGSIIENKEPFKPWALSPTHLTNSIPLKGSQHYRYLYNFDSYKEFTEKKHRIYDLNLYTIFNIPEAFMVKEGYTYFKNMKTEDVSLLSFDIETTGLNWERDDAEVLLITNVIRKRGVLIKHTFCGEDYATQYDMIRDWCIWVMNENPSLVIGHNIVMFDLPYLIGVMSKIGEQLLLGRDESAAKFEVRKNPRELRVSGGQSYSYRRIEIFGRDIVDTFFLAIKADISKKYESYKLKSIIAQEGLEKEGRQHYPADQIKVNWSNPEERKKIIRYGEDDAEDPIKLYDLMGATFFYLCPVVPKSFQCIIESASGSQINSVLVRSYLQEGWSIPKADETEPFQGAISFGVPGKYKNMLKIDFSAMYPSIMREYKVYNNKKDPKANFLFLIEYFAEYRQKYKRLYIETKDKYYDDMQNVAKVIANSCYGFLAAAGLNFNSPIHASFVTAKGRELLEVSIKWATNKDLNYWMNLFEERTA